MSYASPSEEEENSSYSASEDLEDYQEPQIFIRPQRPVAASRIHASYVGSRSSGGIFPVAPASPLQVEFSAQFKYQRKKREKISIREIPDEQETSEESDYSDDDEESSMNSSPSREDVAVAFSSSFLQADAFHTWLSRTRINIYQTKTCSFLLELHSLYQLKYYFHYWIRLFYQKSLKNRGKFFYHRREKGILQGIFDNWRETVEFRRKARLLLVQRAFYAWNSLFEEKIHHRRTLEAGIAHFQQKNQQKAIKSWKKWCEEKVKNRILSRNHSLIMNSSGGYSNCSSLSSSSSDRQVFFPLMSEKFYRSHQIHRALQKWQQWLENHHHYHRDFSVYPRYIFEQFQLRFYFTQWGHRWRKRQKFQSFLIQRQKHQESQCFLYWKEKFHQIRQDRLEKIEFHQKRHSFRYWKRISHQRVENHQKILQSYQSRKSSHQLTQAFRAWNSLISHWKSQISSFHRNSHSFHQKQYYFSLWYYYMNSNRKSQEFYENHTLSIHYQRKPFQSWFLLAQRKRQRRENTDFLWENEFLTRILPKQKRKNMKSLFTHWLSLFLHRDHERMEKIELFHQEIRPALWKRISLERLWENFQRKLQGNHEKADYYWQFNSLEKTIKQWREKVEEKKKNSHYKRKSKGKAKSSVKFQEEWKEGEEEEKIDSSLDHSSSSSSSSLNDKILTFQSHPDRKSSNSLKFHGRSMKISSFFFQFRIQKLKAREKKLSLALGEDGGDGGDNSGVGHWEGKKIPRSSSLFINLHRSVAHWRLSTRRSRPYRTFQWRFHRRAAENCFSRWKILTEKRVLDRRVENFVRERKNRDRLEILAWWRLAVENLRNVEDSRHGEAVEYHRIHGVRGFFKEWRAMAVERKNRRIQLEEEKNTETWAVRQSELFLTRRVFAGWQRFVEESRRLSLLEEEFRSSHPPLVKPVDRQAALAEIFSCWLKLSLRRSNLHAIESALNLVSMRRVFLGWLRYSHYSLGRQRIFLQTKYFSSWKWNVRRLKEFRQEIKQENHGGNMKIGNSQGKESMNQ